MYIDRKSQLRLLTFITFFSSLHICGKERGHVANTVHLNIRCIFVDKQTGLCMPSDCGIAWRRALQEAEWK